MNVAPLLTVIAEFAEVSVTAVRDGAARHGMAMPRLFVEPGRSIAGKAADDAMLAVRVDSWDESRLLSDMRVSFRLQAALVASDGELLWSGGLSGEVKAGGLGPAPRDRDAMARSCAELALNDLLLHLSRRKGQVPL